MGLRRITMLTTLQISNFAIVSHLNLDCPAKMSAFTGETGAGKSIMIDALALLLGARADASVVRNGAEKCELSALFLYDQMSKLHDYLLEQELAEEGFQIIVRRVINRDGRSKFYINGHVSTAQQVKTLGQMLVHIHGQHEQQNLLMHQHHREHLDDFSQANELKQVVKLSFQAYQDSKNALENLKNAYFSKEQAQLWQYQLQELQELNPQVNERQALDAEHHMLHHAKEYLQQLNYLIEGLEDADNSAVLSNLYQLISALSNLPKEEHLIQETMNLLDSACIQIQEASNNLRLFMRQIQLDPERLIEVEERMSKWHQMARKLQVDLDELPEQLAILSEKIAAIEGHDRRLNQLTQEVEIRHTAYLQAAKALRAHRQQYAPELAHAIEQIIHELGMPHAKLSIDIQALEEMHPHGMDKVEYLIATNPGQPKAALAKIASGGELSRISLSIHLITAQRGATPTLLFDEVDVGIGGATAMKVGKRLRELGERLQIFCVTHQPQVASCAHAQFKVSKTTEDEQTYSEIILLDQEERISEIARMLGGLSITDQTRNNAKELLALTE